VKKLSSGANGYIGTTSLYATMGATQFEAQFGRFLNQVTAFSRIEDVVVSSRQFLTGVSTRWRRGAPGRETA